MKDKHSLLLWITMAFISWGVLQDVRMLLSRIAALNFGKPIGLMQLHDWNPLYDFSLIETLFKLIRWPVVLAAICFLIWIYMNYERLVIYGKRGLRFTSKWAAGWFLIPILNISYPVVVLNELYKASGESEDWQNTKPFVIGAIWWVLCLVGVTMNLAFRIMWTQNLDADGVTEALHLSIAYYCLHMVIMVLWMLMIIIIQGRMDELAKNYSEPVQKPKPSITSD
ncbi:MAG: DUF4328 domain-containing protein [Acidobacteriota bacterium]